MKLRFSKRFLIISIIILLYILLFFASCKTKETYLIIVQDQIHIEPKRQNEPTQINRFEKQFHQADSVFMAKLREASKQAAKEASGKINNRR